MKFSIIVWTWSNCILLGFLIALNYLNMFFLTFLRFINLWSNHGNLEKKFARYITFVVDLFIFCSFSLYSKFWFAVQVQVWWWTCDKRRYKAGFGGAVWWWRRGHILTIFGGSFLVLIRIMDLLIFLNFLFLTFSYLLSLWQLPQTNPGFNNTPFKFTKYSNAYMLVYIRESDKDKIVCNVDEKDIAEHLRVRCWYYVYSILFYITWLGQI